MSTITISESRWRKIERALEFVTAAKEEWINEKEACELLNITKETIWNKRRLGEITPDMYTVGVGSNRFYSKQKLMGLNK